MSHEQCTHSDHIMLTKYCALSHEQCNTARCPMSKACLMSTAHILNTRCWRNTTCCPISHAIPKRKKRKILRDVPWAMHLSWALHAWSIRNADKILRVYVHTYLYVTCKPHFLCFYMWHVRSWRVVFGVVVAFTNPHVKMIITNPHGKTTTMGWLWLVGSIKF